MAIFAIGSRVGMFEDQFWALTYLSNVSGLKPGDVVLLGGVEVGNVMAVQIASGELPDTVQNARVMEDVERLQGELREITEAIPLAEQEIADLREEYEDEVAAYGSESEQAKRALAALELAEVRLGGQHDALFTRNTELNRVHARLQNIEVRMRINSRFRDWIRADSSISLGSIGLLGDKYIEISMGRSAESAQTAQVPVEGWLGTTAREFVVVSGIQQASFAELITGANDILANFETLSGQVQNIMRSFEAGEGTVGKFFTDPSAFNNLNKTIENINETVVRAADLIEAMTAGSGTVPRLIQEDALYQRLLSSVENVDGIVQKIEQGEGSIGRLINDPSVHQSTKEMLESLNDFSDRLEAGEGTLGKLSTDDKLYNSLQESVEELSSILRDIEEGKGTLGRLAKDEELYQNLNTLSSEIVKLIYDFRQNPKKFLTIKFELF
jgi:phospholipid/cholesterol/gamma-HCH transport system substrate-binding protein